MMVTRAIDAERAFGNVNVCRQELRAGGTAEERIFPAQFDQSYS